jgi:purine-binding chemotaxis protein CheW
MPMTSDPQIGALLDELGRRREGEAAAAESLPLRRFLGMRLGAELYGISIEHISEISKLTPITFVPGAPAHFLGVTSLRGQIVPVVNLRLLLGLDPAPADAPAARPAGAGFAALNKPRLVVIRQEDRMAGLLVDAVTEVYDLRVRLDPALGVAGRRAQVKEGQTPVGEQMMIVLNAPALIALMEAA